jgi:hypothetical protein
LNKLVDLVESISELNKLWKPLPWQVPAGQALFSEGVKDIGAQCGRSAGKTDFASYSVWRYALEHEQSENYIFEPLQKQAKEILWASQRIQSFGPSEWIKSINNTEMRITFNNGSFIKLDGSDNVEALRGIKPRGLIIYDELKDHKKAFLDAMEPNRARYNSPALYLGTPPEFHNHYVDIMARLETHGHKSMATSYDNPFNSKEWLDRKKDELISNGEEETWLREYMAVFVKGGKRSIFPQINKVRKIKYVQPIDINKWVLVVSCDPASTSIFGIVFMLANRYTKRVIVFDEVYESKPELMTAREILKVIREKIKPFQDRIGEYRFVYDEAAAWFRNEIQELDSSLWFEPSQKARFGVEGYIELVRSFINSEMIQFAESVPKMFWELENYKKDEKGKIPKENDHLINALEYGLGALGLNLDQGKEPVIIPREEPRGFRLEDEFRFSSETQIDHDADIGGYVD